jgi:hypothetical protein
MNEQALPKVSLTTVEFEVLRILSNTAADLAGLDAALAGEIRCILAAYVEQATRG